MNNHPLVSVVVVTYNSSKTILQTLDSIKCQTYADIELIISDDCSNDNTIELCNNWLSDCSDRFVRAIIVTSKTNTGVPSNFNRGVMASTGVWIKTIAGDDLLEENAVEKYIDYVTDNLEVDIVFGRSKIFVEDEKGNKSYRNIIPNDNQLDFYLMSSEEQALSLVQYNNIPAATSFIKRELLVKFPFDESYKYMEDYPYWVKITRLGYKLYFMDNLTVYYRKGAESLTTSKKTLYNTAFMECSKLFYLKERRKEIFLHNYSLFIDREIYYHIYDFARLFLNNRNTRLNILILRIVKLIAKLKIKNIQL